jgi:hypothetical protein
MGDRQWLDMGPTAGAPPGTQSETLYMVYNDIPLGLVIQRSRWTNQGLVWVMGNNRQVVTSNVGSRDHFVVDKTDGTIYLPNKESGGIAVYVSDDGATSFTRHEVESSVDDAQNIFVAADVDNEGNIYLTWSSQTHIYMSASSDKGESWTTTEVTKTNGTRVLPWITAGDPGRVALTWYDTNDTSAPSDENLNGNWSVQVAITTDALADNIEFVQSPILEYVHTGTIRTTGTGGTSDRDLGDFFTCDVDEFGRLIVTFGMDGDDGENARQSVVMFAQQLEGPFLLEETGPEALFDNRTMDLKVRVDARRSFDRNGGGIIDYQWDWGDGTNSSGIMAEHTYNKSGTYKIILKVTNKIDMRDTAFSIVTVTEPAKEPTSLWVIALPIGLLVVGTAVFYYWNKKRKQKTVEVEEI